MNTVSVNVAGMTCRHCAASVHDEVARLPGVTGVDVDLASGLVRIDSQGRVEIGAIRGAVEEAGYRVTN